MVKYEKVAMYTPYETKEKNKSPHKQALIHIILLKIINS